MWLFRSCFSEYYFFFRGDFGRIIDVDGHARAFTRTKFSCDRLANRVHGSVVCQLFSTTYKYSMYIRYLTHINGDIITILFKLQSVHFVFEFRPPHFFCWFVCLLWAFGGLAKITFLFSEAVN